jgi:hypothetical protein
MLEELDRLLDIHRRKSIFFAMNIASVGKLKILSQSRPTTPNHRWTGTGTPAPLASELVLRLAKIICR